MLVFVTGGAGFVGGAVVRQLRARGDEVVAAVRDPDRAGGLSRLELGFAPRPLEAGLRATFMPTADGSDPG